MDEADLVLSYGYEEDLEKVSKLLPKTLQTILVSATLSTEVETLKAIFCRDPVVLDLEEPEAEGEGVTQYVIKYEGATPVWNEPRTDAHLQMRRRREVSADILDAKIAAHQGQMHRLVSTGFWLKHQMRILARPFTIQPNHSHNPNTNMSRINSVADVDRCYRLKLFLGQFGIKSCVLNSELPVNSRINVVEEFNQSIYRIIIASDELEVLGDEDHEGAGEDATVDATKNSGENGNADSQQEAGTSGLEKRQSRKRRKISKKGDYGVSRGIDFQGVACVLNFDFPLSSKSYQVRFTYCRPSFSASTAPPPASARRGQRSCDKRYSTATNLRGISRRIPPSWHTSATIERFGQGSAPKHICGMSPSTCCRRAGRRASLRKRLASYH